MFGALFVAIGGRAAGAVLAVALAVSVLSCRTGSPSSAQVRKPEAVTESTPDTPEAPPSALPVTKTTGTAVSPEPAAGAPPGWRDVVDFPPLVSPALASLFERSRRELDPAQWFFSHPQTPPKGFRPWPARIAGPFPGEAPHKVIAHVYALDNQKAGAPLLDLQVPGCGGDLISAEGTRCPTVSYPGRELSSVQVAELLAIANQPNDVSRTIMNSYLARYGFVFLDSRERPFAQALVNADVNKLVLSPRIGDEIDTLMPERRERLRALLTELELGGPLGPDLGDLLQVQRSRDGDLFRLRTLPYSAGVSPEVPLSELSTEQKLKLCYWYVRAGFRAHAEAGYQCENGARRIGQDLADCVNTFPSCERTVGEAEECMRRLRVDPCHERPESRACSEERECLWGQVETPGTVGVSCDVWQHRWQLALTVRSAAARSRLLGRLMDPLCKGSKVYVTYSGMELQAMFGRHVNLSGVVGAGNSLMGCGWSAEVSPPDFLPARFGSDVSRFEFVTDAKFELIEDLGPCR